MGASQNGSTPILTRKERELLTLLESHPGRCYSRPYLLKTIWGYSNDTRTRTVDVHVSRLRKKLRGRSDVLIHTVVRRGYVLQRDGYSGNGAELDPTVAANWEPSLEATAQGCALRSSTPAR